MKKLIATALLAAIPMTAQAASPLPSDQYVQDVVRLCNYASIVAGQGWEEGQRIRGDYGMVRSSFADNYAEDMKMSPEAKRIGVDELDVMLLAMDIGYQLRDYRYSDVTSSVMDSCVIDLMEAK